jgi:hypothetical protein
MLWFLKFILEMKLHVSDSSSVHHQELFPVHTAMVYVVQVCRQLSSSRIRKELQFHPVSARKLSVWLSVQWITPDDGQRNCVKHVEFHIENKFGKLAHLVGFIMRNFDTIKICHKHTLYAAYVSKG